MRRTPSWFATVLFLVLVSGLQGCNRELPPPRTPDLPPPRQPAPGTILDGATARVARDTWVCSSQTDIKVMARYLRGNPDANLEARKAAGGIRSVPAGTRVKLRRKTKIGEFLFANVEFLDGDYTGEYGNIPDTDITLDRN